MDALKQSLSLTEAENRLRLSASEDRADAHTIKRLRERGDAEGNRHQRRLAARWMKRQKEQSR